MEITKFEKIPNVFYINPKTHMIDGLIEPFKTLADVKCWDATEKIDGANTRICWDGHAINILGRTDDFVAPANVSELWNQFEQDKNNEYLFEQVFGEKTAIVYCETYGDKINGGSTYYKDVRMIAFDIDINGLRVLPWREITKELGLASVPLLFSGSINDAISYVRKHNNSTINAKHEMEGVVCKANIPIYTRDRIPCECKIKWQDILLNDRKLKERTKK